MEHTVKQDEERNLSIISFTGKSSREAEALNIKKIALGVGSTRILFDFREVTFNTDAFSTYSAVDQVSKESVPNESAFRLAFLYSGDISQHDFLQDLLINRGFPVTFFSDYDEALAFFDD